VTRQQHHLSQERPRIRYFALILGCSRSQVKQAGQLGQLAVQIRPSVDRTVQLPDSRLGNETGFDEIRSRAVAAPHFRERDYPAYFVRLPELERWA
jgi:hypothetical protein